MQGFGTAQAFESALFEDAQKFRLHAGGERCNFVEDDGSGLRHFQAAGFARDSPGERAAFVAEQFGFDELGRQAGAINFQEWRVVPWAALMDPARELVFAGATFTCDQHGCGGAGNFFGEIEDPPGRGVGCNPGNGRGGAHGFLLTAIGNLSNTSPRFAIAAFHEKWGEHSQEWLCHNFVFDETSNEHICEWLCRHFFEALTVAWRCLRIRCGARRGI